MHDDRARTRQRLLFVAPWVPSKQRPRSLGMLRALASDYDLVVFLLVWSDGDDADARELSGLLPEGTPIVAVVCPDGIDLSIFSTGIR